MILVEVEQGTPEWLRARLGMPTASEFVKILTPTGKLSAQARDFAFRLVAEELLQEPIVSLDGLDAIVRGKMLEPDAAQAYEFQYDKETMKVGLITTDDGRVGCSPDRIVRDGGLLEIKCPYPQTHVSYMIDGFDAKYKPQVQGQLWITGLPYCEWFSYHPQLPPVLMRMDRDEEFIEKLAKSIGEFLTMRDDLLEKVKKQGLLAEQIKLLAAE